MKRIVTIIFFTALLFTLGCNKDKKIIPRDDMVSVLVKIHLMDGAMQISQYNPDFSLPDTLDVYEVVLEDYGYTRAQFDTSVNYYSKDLKKFDRIYQEVLARLNKMETAAQETDQNPEKKQGATSQQGKGRAPSKE